MNRRVAVLTSMGVVLGGCASAFKTPPADANYGLPPVNYEDTVKAYFERFLKDPESARYRFGKPIKAYANNGLAYGGNVTWIGYMMDVGVNAKNSYGGYTGFKPYMVMFVGNAVHMHYEGSEHILVHRME